MPHWCVQFDFYTYAQLTSTLKKVFFPTTDEVAQSLAFWSVYAIGECPQRCAMLVPAVHVVGARPAGAGIGGPAAAASWSRPPPKP